MRAGEHVNSTQLPTLWLVLGVLRLGSVFHILSLALELTADVCDEVSLERWLGEPVKCVVVSTRTFLSNAKGYPVLSKVHQAYFRRLLQVRGLDWEKGRGEKKRELARERDRARVRVCERDRERKSVGARVIVYVCVRVRRSMLDRKREKTKSRGGKLSVVAAVKVLGLSLICVAYPLPIAPFAAEAASYSYRPAATRRWRCGVLPVRRRRRRRQRRGRGRDERTLEETMPASFAGC